VIVLSAMARGGRGPLSDHGNIPRGRWRCALGFATLAPEKAGATMPRRTLCRLSGFPQPPNICCLLVLPCRLASILDSELAACTVAEPALFDFVVQFSSPASTYGTCPHQPLQHHRVSLVVIWAAQAAKLAVWTRNRVRRACLAGTGDVL
jgi:hypothetical protein